MNKHIQALMMGCTMALGASSVALAAESPDPVLGTWSINLEQSKFHPGGAPRSMTRTYSVSARGTDMKVTGVAPDGIAFTQTTTLTYDGKDCVVTGALQYDAFALKKINGSTIRSQIKKAGTVIGTSTRTISDRGRVLKLDTSWKGAKGETIHDLAIFDKQ